MRKFVFCKGISLSLGVAVGFLGAMGNLIGSSTALAAVAPPEPSEHTSASVHSTTGPTLKLDYAQGQDRANTLAEFMYFVPLISPEPVSLLVSPGNTQRARVTSYSRRTNGNSFVVTCDFELAGEGRQQNVFDHREVLRRHESELKSGATLKDQLSSINVEGSGSGIIEVEGTTEGGAQTVTEVRLRFNGSGKPSPVSIALQDIAYDEGAYRPRKEVVASVNTLTFKQQPGPPKMGVTVASVKPKNAGNGFWQNFKGSVLAKAANLLIKPVAMERAGHKAMLDFGLALTTTARAFTFPSAPNLRPTLATATVASASAGFRVQTADSEMVN